MPRGNRARGTLVLLGLLCLPAVGARASTPPQVDPSQIAALAVSPQAIQLSGIDATVQMLVTGKLANGHEVDLTRKATYQLHDASRATVDPTGLVRPLADGQTTLTVSFGSHTLTVPVAVRNIAEPLPINFANQIVPTFTKLGCNAGGCHGKASGQNGFKLSLLGFEPDYDYEALVKEAKGRRLFPAAPEASLLLLKATARVPHGGGKRMEVGSPEYQLIRRWIAAGLPYGKPDDPTVTKITVEPEHRVVFRGGQQQLRVVAHYSDGSTADVTRQAQYQSNASEVAQVGEDGLVYVGDQSGEAAIMARYQGLVAVFRATVPLGVPTPAWEFPISNFVDRHTSRKWRELGIVPSEICSDEEFIRRASLDICGTLPTPDEVRQFCADSDPQKRAKLVDRLLERPEYADFFALKWADILRVVRGTDNENRYGTFAFWRWIREQIHKDTPYDQFVLGVLAAQGNMRDHPPVAWYRQVTTVEQAVDDTAQVFLGLRIQCARCHHHPFEKWSQDDYYGFAAFFARVARKPGDLRQEEQIYLNPNARVVHPKKGNVMKPKGLDGPEFDVGPDEDPRVYLVQWLRDPQNPFFARAICNRMWAHFFGRGIVDPEDDMRVTNPPTNPELLNDLARDFIENGFRLKHLVRVICTSTTYQLSCLPNEWNKQDTQNFARYYPKRLPAEVLHDAIVQVTNVPTQFSGMPLGTRAIQLPDEAITTYFLTVFGKPTRQSACECERAADANLAQSLHLLNSQEIQSKVADGNSRASLLARDSRPDDEKLRELWLWCFARKPKPEELDPALKYVQSKQDKKQAYEDVLWALINTKEFLFVH
jgi:hypothetical protein